MRVTAATGKSSGNGNDSHSRIAPFARICGTIISATPTTANLPFG